MRFLSWGLVVLAGCGRLAFDPLGNGDASMMDTDDGPQAIGPVSVQFTASNSCNVCNSLILQIAPGPPDDPGYRRVALLAIASGMNVGGATPAATSVAYGSVPMNGAMRVVHPDATFKPTLELWQLSDPPAGPVNITAIFDGTVSSIEVGIVIVDGVHPTQPIRTFGTGTGRGMTTTATGNSAVDDVMIDIVCAGTSIDAEDPANSQLIDESLGNVSSCGNLHVGRRAGASPSITSRWMVNAAQLDFWVQLMASIQPP